MITHAYKALGWIRNNTATQKQPPRNKLLQLSLAIFLLFFGGSAWAATFTATVDGTFPLQMAPGETKAGAFAVTLAASGAFKNHSGSINVCDAVTLSAGGAVDCTHVNQINIPNSTGAPPTISGFPMDVQVAVTVAADVACGTVYDMSVDVWLDVTGGANFGNDGTQDILQVELPFTVQVLCPDLAPQGCSQGYWKNHTESWMGYSPNDNVSNLFSSAPAELGDKTLLDALSFKGGSTLLEASEILLRQAVAAALNDSHYLVAYPRPLNEIQFDVNEALDSASRSNILGLAAALDGDNNLGCPLE